MNQIEKYSELIGKYLAGEIGPAEQEELFAWTEAEAVNRKFFEETVQVWEMTANAELSPFETDMRSAWEKIEGGITGEKPSVRVVPLSKIIRRWSVAAAILLAFGLGLWWMVKQSQSQMVEIQTQENEKREVNLPDGSRIWLNENTRLAYDSRFKERHVTLEGEAFFEVERMEERPFKIFSGEVTTTVLGTSFNVRAYPAENIIEVTVETGKVAFAPKAEEKSPVILTAGSSGVFNKKEKKITVAEEKVSNAEAWKTQRLEFDETPVKEVIQALERYFDVDIEVSNSFILDCTYTSDFDHPELEHILTVLSGTLNLEIAHEGESYLLSGKGCEPDN